MNSRVSIAGFAATSKALEAYGADEPNGSGPKCRPDGKLRRNPQTAMPAAWSLLTIVDSLQPRVRRLVAGWSAASVGEHFSVSARPIARARPPARRDRRSTGSHGQPCRLETP